MYYTPSVPNIFNEIKIFIDNCAKFAEGLNSSQTELDDMVRKPTNKLITDRLKENLSNLIFNTNENDLPKLVKIVVNTLFLEKSIDLLERHLLHVIK
jgi:exocyst complex component 6